MTSLKFDSSTGKLITDKKKGAIPKSKPNFSDLSKPPIIIIDTTKKSLSNKGSSKSFYWFLILAISGFIFLYLAISI
jgi:hypothetical protein